LAVGLSLLKFIQKTLKKDNMDNPLISPNFGLVVWQAIVLLLLIIILRWKAWKPILKALSAREEAISGALSAAEEAKEEMAKLQSSNEDLLNEARAERDKLMKEARETKDEIVAEAKNAAKSEADKIMDNARETIKMEKTAAITELKTQVAALSIEVAEKVVKGQLSDDKKQQELVNNLIEEVNLN
jgi:F-type H+-transporting ATPase subunit b